MTAHNPRQSRRDPTARLTAPPEPPPLLSERAAAEWRRLAPVAVAPRTLSEPDLRGFELLVQTLATEAEAPAVIEAGGGGHRSHQRQWSEAASGSGRGGKGAGAGGGGCWPTSA